MYIHICIIYIYIFVHVYTPQKAWKAWSAAITSREPWSLGSRQVAFHVADRADKACYFAYSAWKRWIMIIMPCWPPRAGILSHVHFTALLTGHVPEAFTEMEYAHFIAFHTSRAQVLQGAMPLGVWQEGWHCAAQRIANESGAFDSSWCRGIWTCQLRVYWTAWPGSSMVRCFDGSAPSLDFRSGLQALWKKQHG